MTGPPVSRRATALVAALTFVVGVLAAGVVKDFASNGVPGASAQMQPGVTRYTLEIVPKDIEVAPGVIWHAWTYNGTVPGPLLTVTVGDTLLVTVKNKLDIVHSFHTHLAPYSLENDGSQINSITGVGAGAMIPPGGEYTYEFHPTIPGVYYYHCHSADGGKMISQHIAQGLYGAIVVKAPDEQPIRDEAILLGEMGFNVEGDGAPFYIMNGKGIPGGERALEAIYAEKGLDGVVAEFGKTVPIIKAKLNEPVRLALINVGDQIHSFHLHGMNAVSVDQMPGRIHPNNVVQLLPGGADRVIITPTYPGVWLFHCHVVSHADLGMIGVMVVE